METLLKRFEKIITYLLLFCGMFAIVFQSVTLVWELFSSLVNRVSHVGLSYAPEYNRNAGVLFFNVLLTMEILETIKIFNKDHEVKMRIILLVCLIAISRKILELDVMHGDPASEVALAALVLALSVGYFLVQRNRPDKKENIITKNEE